MGEELQRLFRITRLLHIDADKRAVLLRPSDNGAHVVDAKSLVDVEPHLGELDRNVGVGLRVADAVEQVEIGRARPSRFLGMQHRFPEQVERRGEVAVIQLSERVDRLRGGLTGDEPRCQFARETVFPHEAENARLFAQPQKDGSQHQE